VNGLANGETAGGNTPMKCPVCKEVLIYHAVLESRPSVHRCPKCEGLWISSDDYLRWLGIRRSGLPARTEEDGSLPTVDTTQVKLCPGCGHFLHRYRVSPSISFHLDHCGNCNGVWFDRNEWDVLVNLNLHDKVNQFFTEPWQTRLRDEETRKRLEALYLEKFGADDYARVKDIRNWLMQNPHRAMLLAYLQSDDPYRA
jgi:Zn-finger nucleic acid-binding protein